MGIIDSRLNKIMQAVKETTGIPVIIETFNPPSSSDVQELRNYMSVTRTSNIVSQVYGNATSYGIQNIANMGFVSRVVYDEPISRLGLPVITYSKEDIHVPVSQSTDFIGCGELHNIGLMGKGIKIAVVDTGVNKYHPMMQGAVTKQINIPKKYGVECDIQDGNGHGSHVATTIAGRPVTFDSLLLEKQVTLYGAAPEAEIFGIKVLDDEGSGQTSWVMEGIEKAVEWGADIINLSLGSIYDGAGQSPDSKLIDTITFEYGKLCCVAAGNSFVNFSIGSPGGSMGALTVASNSIYLPSEGVVSSFSSKGSTTDGRIKPDISAPGGNLLNVKESIYAGTSGELAEEAGEAYIGILGTSMATPHVSGAMALLLQAGMKPDRYYIEDLVSQSAKFQHPKDVLTGWGMLDIFKAYQLFSSNASLIPVSNIMRAANLALYPLSQLIPQQEQTVENNKIKLPYFR